MRLCYLILAHQQAGQLRRLVEPLLASGGHVFIHLDAKVPLEPFRSQLPEHPHLHWVAKRQLVQWAGYSMVEATFNLINAATSSGEAFDYYALLSGADYPIQHPQALAAFLREHAGEEFINSTPMPCPTGYKPLSRLSTFRLETLPYDLRPGVVGRFMARAVRIINRFEFQRDYERVFAGLTPYADHQWWVLSHAAICVVQAFAKERPEVIRFFRHTVTPDEGVFQTILSNSVLAPQIRHTLTYTEWVPGASHPVPISAGHIEKWAREGLPCFEGPPERGAYPYFFARKFHPEDDALLEAVRARLWTSTPLSRP